MRTIKEYDPTDYYFLLKSVIDSRLLFSTKKYIAEHIGYSSLTSKPIKDIITRPFLAKSIFEGLSKEVDFMCDNNINLENFIMRYQQASEYFRKHKSFKFFKNNEEDCSHKGLFDFLDMIYKDNCIHESLSEKEKKVMSDIYDEEEDAIIIDPSIILMLALEVFPTFNKGGDLSSRHEKNLDESKRSIEEDFKTMYKFLKGYIQHLEYDELIPLNILERTIIEAPKAKDSNEKYDAIPALNRITLYWHVSSILSQIDINEHPDKSREATISVRETQLFPNISGYWSLDKSGVSDSYWIVKQTIWGYTINMCQKKGDTIEYDSAELYLFDYTDNYYDNNIITEKKNDENFRRGLYHGLIAKSKYIASKLDESIASDKSDIFTFVCYIDFKEDTPISIEFFPFSSYESFRHCTYHAISPNSQIVRLDNKLTKKNIGTEYYCRNCLVAITREYIYIGCVSKEQICSEDDYIPDIHYDSFYQIPKSLNISFYDYTINSFLGLLIATLNSKEHLYIAAIDSMDFYEVTTTDDMKKYGIEIVKQIGQK